MKIAILHYACYPVVGGVESIISTHARLFEAAGHEPFIIAGRGNPAAISLPGVIIPEIDSKHPDVLKVQAALLRGEEWAGPEFERLVACISDLLSDALKGANACIVHNAFTLHKNLALTVALAQLAVGKESDKRWVAWCHDLAWSNPLYVDELSSGWPWEALKTQLPNVTYVAISEQRRAEMAHLFGLPRSSITLVPNGIDPEMFIPCSPQMSSLRTRFNWDERDWVLLAPVRVTRRKNLGLALQITAAMRAGGGKPLLVITGPPGPHNPRSDEYFNELLRLRAALDLREEAVFLALEGAGGGPLHVSDDMVNELYWWSDALLVTSVQEGFGLPLLEAGLARLPIFCSSLPVLREVGAENAHYFNPRDNPTNIAEMIRITLEEPGIAAMRRKVLTSYTWDAIFHERVLPLLA
ncbi:MAG TPA: glycosyltransferase [Chloroflexia bacterium]|nr:glycosyltransferase [Chloroflexia bacterium]